MAGLSSTAPVNLKAFRRPEPGERHIFAWGDNTFGQCLQGNSAENTLNVPRPAPCRNAMRSLAAAWEHSFLVTEGGSLWGGGANRERCLCEENDNEDEQEERLPLSRLNLVELEGQRFEAVQGGRDHFLAILEEGRAVLSWGQANEFGQVGRGGPSLRRVPPGAVNLGGIAVRQVACGESHSLVLTVRGEVFAFGGNAHGMLGTGNLEPSFKPVRVDRKHLRAVPVRGIAAGSRHSMALSVGGSVFCWGCNGHGRLGLGPQYDCEESVPAPTMVEGLPDMARAVAGGGHHSAALLRRGRLFLAGDNRMGQLGQLCTDIDWSSTFYELPFQGYSFRVRTVSLGASHTLMLSYDGDLYSCGRNAEGQLGACFTEDPSSSEAPPKDEPIKVSLDTDNVFPEGLIVWGISAGSDHNVVLTMTPPEHSHIDRTTSDRSGRPQSCSDAESDLFRTLSVSGPTQLDKRWSATATLPFGKPALREQDEETSGDGDGGDELLPHTLSSGCTSLLSNTQPKLYVPMSPKRLHSAADGDTPLPEEKCARSSASSEPVLLQPIVQPGVASSVGFAALSIARLKDLLDSAVNKRKPMAVVDLRRALAVTFATPALLNASFCFPGLYRPRLDASGVLRCFRELEGHAEILQDVEQYMGGALSEGLRSWGIEEYAVASEVRHRDQLRGLPVLLLCPLLADCKKTQGFLLMKKIARLVAWMPAKGRRELQEAIIEDCGEEAVLRHCLVPRVRGFCDESIRRAAQAQRLSPEIWEGLLLLQVLWGANEAAAERLSQNFQLREPMLNKTLTRTQTSLNASRPNSAAVRPQCTSTATTGVVAIAPQIRPVVPATEFQLQSLTEPLVPPELEFRLFSDNARGGALAPSEVLSLELEGVTLGEPTLPREMRSFMANRNLVPVAFTRKVLRVENHVAQSFLQHQAAMNAAADLDMLPGHEIRIDPAKLFFILKVRRDHILDDALLTLQSATPEDLRRQLKVIFEGEQGVDEGGVAREFFRLLGAEVFSTQSGLFDENIAKTAHVLWFKADSAKSPEDFWLAGVILGLAVYNNTPGLDARLPALVFKKITGEKLTLDDLQQVHPDIATSLRAVLRWEPEGSMSSTEANELFESMFGLDFTVSSQENGQPKVHELKTNGADVNVTLETREEFVKLYAEWILVTSVEKQFNPFWKGVRRVCDSPLFNALDAMELERIVCGEPVLDFAALRQFTRYEGFTEDSDYVKAFWSFLEAFDLEEKKQFLRFITGSDLAPVGGLQELRLIVQRNGGEPTERLPTGHTCFCMLLLPEYESTEKLHAKLDLALRNSEGFGLE